jgi:hypothetical protein
LQHSGSESSDDESESTVAEDSEESDAGEEVVLDVLKTVSEPVVTRSGQRTKSTFVGRFAEFI